MSIVFKKFEDGEVIALITDDKENGMIGSYMRVGQHSLASIELLDDLEDANPSEYESLKQEMQSIGYEFS